MRKKNRLLTVDLFEKFSHEDDWSYNIINDKVEVVIFLCRYKEIRHHKVS